MKDGVLKLFAELSVKKNVNSACMWWMYVEKPPYKAKKFKKH